VSTVTAYVGLVSAVAGMRVVELAVARRNARWSFARGGVETGRGHYPVMVALHAGLLGGAVAEVSVLQRPFRPVLGWPALGAVAASVALRWWCIATLGPRWNTRVIVVPGLPPVTTGPYRCLRHPNYAAVVVEGAALPLVHTAWLTAATFTALNLPLLALRLRVEEHALATLPPPERR
jgi:methyltransferase